MKLSRNDVGVLALIAVSGAAGMVMFRPWRLVERTVTVESRFESAVVAVEAVEAIEVSPPGVSIVRLREGAERPPIVYLDGVRLEGGFETVPPETIDRVEVLKGEAALQKFGPEASAGVVQIFTKKGGSGS